MLGASLTAVTLIGSTSSAQAAGPPTCDGLRPTIVGTPAKDRIIGTPGRDVIVGLDGDDVIEGRGGDDVICGNAGADRLKGGPGNDRLFGQLGRVFDAGRGSGVYQLKEDLLIGGPGNDTVVPVSTAVATVSRPWTAAAASSGDPARTDR